MIASAFYHESGDLELSAPFDRTFVDRLKTRIPHSAREWNPDRRRWIVEAPYADVAIGLMREHWPDAEILNPPKPQSQACACKANPDLVTLCVRPDTPAAVITAAYRALSKELHPDHGGSTEAMQELNAAFGRLKERQAVTHGR